MPMGHFGIGTYQPVSGGTVYATGFPSPAFSQLLLTPLSGVYGGQYGFVVDTTIKQPQNVQYSPAPQVGLDNLGIAVVRGFPSVTWNYTTMRPDYWYYLQNLWKRSQMTPSPFQGSVLLLFPSADGTNTPTMQMGRWEPPTMSNRDVGAFYGVTLTFRSLGLFQVPASTLIQFHSD